ncbi:MAG: flagellar basal body P-ring protein FlgI [Candidatus Eisenbacteria bacterium]|nr:flagellar basal body P-ring protein FlgI [Candidatus Eisenbacteria bacterium]
MRRPLPSAARCSSGRHNQVRSGRRAGRLALLLTPSLLLTLFATMPASAARIRDVARFQGMRDNQLVGYGLVVGLDGTGDKKSTGFTMRSMSNLLESVGLTIRPEEMAVKNVAAVMVTATLPPYARPGSKLDVNIASIGDATSLRGGVLIQTSLEAADGRVYAVAQGPIAVGGYSADSPGGTRVSQNQVTVGRISGGAIIEREVPRVETESRSVDLILERPDFTTASRVVLAVNQVVGGGAFALDPGTIRIPVADTTITAMIDLMARVGEVEVDPGSPSRVVINERTGTVVAGGSVRVHPVAISHGNLSIRIQNQTDVVAAPPFSPPGTQSTTVQNSDIRISDSGGAFITLPGTSTIEQLAAALNALGVSPRDVIAIFQALDEAGALDADLVVI